MLRPKEREMSFCNSLSEGFLKFANSPNMNRNPEFKQVEKLFNIDLSFMVNIPTDYEPNTHEYKYYQLPDAEEAGDFQKMEEITREIQRMEKAWEDNYETLNEGWTIISAMRKTTQQLIELIQQHPNWAEQLILHDNWGEYFSNSKQIHIINNSTQAVITQDCFLYDLEKIIEFTEEATEKGVEYGAMMIM